MQLRNARRAGEQVKTAKLKTLASEGQFQVLTAQPGSFSALAARSSKRVPPAVRLKRHLRSCSVLRCLRRAVCTVAEDCDLQLSGFRQLLFPVLQPVLLLQRAPFRTCCARGSPLLYVDYSHYSRCKCFIWIIKLIINVYYCIKSLTILK